jgi:hypothetical protein
MEMKMSTDKPNKPTEDLFEIYLGPPPLLEGEDKARYLHLRTAVAAHMNPKNIFDHITVKEITDKAWEEQRYKLAATALINGGMAEALRYYLNEIYSGVEADDKWDTYCNADAKGRKAVLSSLEQYGITFAQLQAKAAQIESKGLILFDRMITTREKGRHQLRKEVERKSRDENEEPDDTPE